MFTKVDCYRLYVPNLAEGLIFYKESLALRIIWKTDTAVDLGMDNDVTELLIHNEHKGREVDFKVESAEKALAIIKTSGDRVINGPFDIKNW